MNGTVNSYLSYLYTIYKKWFLNIKEFPIFIDDDGIRRRYRNEGGPAIIHEDHIKYLITLEKHYKDNNPNNCMVTKIWRVKGIQKSEEWVKKYLEIKNKHMIDGVMVSDYWKIREIILRWRYNPKLQCVKNRINREFDSLY
jgi:hypothetical protein